MENLQNQKSNILIKKDKIDFPLLKSYLNDLILNKSNKKESKDDYTSEYIVNLIKDNEYTPELILNYLNNTTALSENINDIFTNLNKIIQDMQTSTDGIGKEIIKQKIDILERINKEKRENLTVLENLRTVNVKTSKQLKNKYKSRSRSRTRSISYN